MHLLLRLLKTIQPPRLDKEGWGLIADIYGHIEKKEFAYFQEAYLRTNKPNGAVAEFMRHWFDVTQELRELHSLIDKKLTENDKVFIITLLLPKDLETLNLIHQKLETLCHVAIKDSDLFDIMKGFSIAVLRALNEKNQQETAQLKITLSDSETQSIVNRIFNALLVKKLTFFCTNYLRMITNHISQELKDDILCLSYYKLTQGNKEINIAELIKSEIKAISFNAAMIKPTPTLHLLFIKFIHAEELSMILGGTIKYVEENNIHTMTNAPHDERLIVFSHTFKDYITTFQKRTRDTSYSIFGDSNTAYHILEDEFISVCSNITENITQRAIKPMV